jgi:BASS family bile acid:Na+ symporter
MSPRTLAIAIPFLTVLLLFAIGLDLTTEDLGRVGRQKAVVLAGLIPPAILLPVAALVLVALFRPPHQTVVGLLLVAGCPIGGIANAYAWLARASTALAVMLTGLSCLLAGLTMPVFSAWVHATLGEGYAFPPPTPLLFLQALAVLGFPVAAGMWVRHRMPGIAERHRNLLALSSFAGSTALMAFVIVSDKQGFVEALRTTVPVAAAFIGVSMAMGWAAGLVVGASPADRFTLLTVFATRNLAIATAIAVTVLGRLEFAVFATTYYLTELPMMLVAIAAHGRLWRR